MILLDLIFLSVEVEAREGVLSVLPRWVPVNLKIAREEGNYTCNQDGEKVIGESMNLLD